MAEPEPVLTELRKPLPEAVEIDLSDPMVPHTSAEITLVKRLSGKRYMDLVGEQADDGERFQTMVWLRLRRMGYEPSWEEAGQVLIRWVNVPVDPTSAAPSMASPASAAFGAAPPETLTD